MRVRSVGRLRGLMCEFCVRSQVCGKIEVGSAGCVVEGPGEIVVRVGCKG